MRTLRLFFTCLFIILANPAGAAGTAKIDWNDTQLQWLSYQEGIVKLKQTGQRGILIVYADWCGTCKAYSTLFKDPKVVSALRGLVLMRANRDTDGVTSKKFGNDGEYVPRTLALSSNGDILTQAYARNDQFAYFIPADEPVELMEFLRRIKTATR